jgi:hypothetical protein
VPHPTWGLPLAPLRELLGRSILLLKEAVEYIIQGIDWIGKSRESRVLGRR